MNIAYNIWDLVSLLWRPLDIMIRFNIFVDLKLHLWLKNCLLSLEMAIRFTIQKL